MTHVTQQELKSLLSYDQDTGEFTWLRRTSGRNWVGKVAGCRAERYIVIGIRGRLYAAHRLAFLWMRDEYLDALAVDHVNGDGYDNRWGNLRKADYLTNNQNIREAQINNLSGLLGVSRSQTPGKFVARIHHAGRQLSLGTFTSQEAAHQAYLTAKRELHAGCTI